MAQKIVTDLQILLGELREKKLLLVCGRSFDSLDFAEAILALKPVRFSGFSANPVYEDVCRGLELFRKEGCNAILAVGGGSAMDVAKCIKLFSGMKSGELYLNQPYADTDVFLAAIPTTAGTGSESTRHAVIYYQGVKQSISHQSLVPEIACLVPSVLDKLPAYQKKCTMLDALCQAIESWWSVNSCAESRAYSCIAMETIRDNWKAYLEAGDKEAAEKILLAANYAGRAINITATTAPHAMSYKLTSLYGLPHGHAVALCLPEVWEYMLGHLDQTADSRGEAWVRAGLESLPVSLGWFRQLMADLNMTYPTAENREGELDLLTRSVNPTRLKNNPVYLSEETLRGIYERVLK